jgi:hypothetical protein
LILVDVGDVVEDQQVILVEFGYRALKGEFTTRDLYTRERQPMGISSRMADLLGNGPILSMRSGLRSAEPRGLLRLSC